jgi:D,D-heptose 1,7-bisphosphate phosphatase
LEDVVILVGGKGSRLGDITKNTPKPFLEINKEPFLITLMNDIHRFGFQKFILLAGHANDVLIEYFKKNKFNYQVEVIVENEPLGTGGAIINALPKISENFFCFNGDSFLKGNWLKIKNLISNNVDAAVALSFVKDPSRYGNVLLNSQGLVENFSEKSNKNNLINAGVYFFKKKLFKNYENKYISLENEIFPELVLNKKICGQEIYGDFIDIGLPESLMKARKSNIFQHKYSVVFDRDGTINIDNGYTYKVSDLKFNPYITKFISYLNERNILAVVATNQSGIAREIFSEDDMHLFHRTMQHRLHKENAHIDSFFYCPFHIDATSNVYKLNSKLRKPNTGMLQLIKEKWNLEKDNMLMIGDKDSDIECATNFNIDSLKYRNTMSLEFLVKHVESKFKTNIE